MPPRLSILASAVWALATAPLCVGADSAVNQPATVIAIDGSQIPGELKELSGETLKLDSPDLFSPADLKTSQILEVILPAKEGQVQSDHIATVTLSNGDVLRGSLQSVDAQTIGLHTWYAGDLKFRRSMVDSLEIDSMPQRVYSGPNAETDWEQSDPKKWDVAAGYMTARGAGTVSRMLKLPPRIRFSFDIAWRQTARFHVLFFMDQPYKDRQPHSYYDLTCQNRYVYLRKIKDDRSVNIPGNIDVREFNQEKRAHMEVLVNRESGMMRLLVNGRVLFDWTDPDPGGGHFGGGIGFTNDDGSALRISRIEVSDWDGVVDTPGPVAEPDPNDETGEEPSAEPEPPASPTRIRLRNGDEVDGETAGIESGIVKLKTTFGDVDIPVSRLSTFALHTPDQRKDPALYEIPRLYADDVRATLPDGSRVTFRLKGVKEGRVQAYSQPMGDATFDMSAFQRLEFNLYQKALDAQRAKERW